MLAPAPFGAFLNTFFAAVYWRNPKAKMNSFYEKKLLWWIFLFENHDLEIIEVMEQFW